MFSLEQLVRPNIWKLAPYSSARDEYSGHEAHVFLDANENPYNAPYNRYPDPLQRELKSVLKKVKGVPEDMIFLGNGSDEAIDLAYRVFCNPGIDNVVAIAPSYGMYKVCADINDIEYRTVLLDEHYQFSADKLLAACDAHTKIIWLCSPNNPTGNSLDRDEMLKVVNQFQGIVIIDEAYIDFAQQLSMRQELPTHPNLIPFEVDKWVRILLDERTRLMQAFTDLPIVQQVFPTDANFFLARMTDAQAIYDYLVNEGVIVRNRTRVQLCQNCLRITIGSHSENNELIGALRKY